MGMLAHFFLEYTVEESTVPQLNSGFRIKLTKFINAIGYALKRGCPLNLYNVNMDNSTIGTLQWTRTLVHPKVICVEQVQLQY